MSSDFVTALSEKNADLATKDLSLKIKSQYNKTIDFLIVLFTPHYQPLTIMKNLGFSLQPKHLVGIQTPLLIFDDRIIQKGLVGLAITKESVSLQEFMIKDDSAQNIEAVLRRTIRPGSGDKNLLFSILPPDCKFSNFLRGLSLGLGKSFNVFGAGYMKKYSQKHFIISENNIQEGIANFSLEGIKTDCLKMDGFLPLGLPFTITKAIADHGIIMEINNQPAIKIYEEYFEEKMAVFKKRCLFPFYPLGIKQNNALGLVSVLDALDDGSLVCLGPVEENTQARFMLLHQPTLFDSVKSKLSPILKSGGGLIFMINSLLRKKILAGTAGEEIKLVKSHLGDKFKIIGIFSDFSIFPDKERPEISMEIGNLLINLWQ